MYNAFLLVNILSVTFLTYRLLYKQLRIPIRWLIVLYVVAYAVYIAVFAWMHCGEKPAYMEVQRYEMFASYFFFAWLPFFLVRKSLWQNGLIYAVRASAILVAHGFSNYAELKLGGAFANRYPYVIATIVSLLVMAILYPALYILLKNILALWPEKNTAYTRTLWVIPASVAFLSMSNQTILNGEHIYDSLFVLILRLVLLLAVVLVMWITSMALRSIRDRERLAARMKIADIQIDNQRKQYEAMASDIDYANRLRHDMRHQRIAIMGYLDHKDISGAREYISGIMNAPENADCKLYCQNYAVNSLINHYAQRLAENGAKTQFQLDIPRQCGRIQDSDLCIVVGNLLENAFEACERMQSTSKSVDVRAKIQGDRLLFTVINTYNGQLVRRGDLYMSLKERKSSEENTGIGLASVRSVCGQYDGELRISTDGHMWTSACVLVM